MRWRFFALADLTAFADAVGSAAVIDEGNLTVELSQASVEVDPEILLLGQAYGGVVEDETGG